MFSSNKSEITNLQNFEFADQQNNWIDKFMVLRRTDKKPLIKKEEIVSALWLS